MKQLLSAFGLLTTLFTVRCYAQEIPLPEVTILTRNYKYLRATDKDAAQPVQALELKAATYDLKNTDFYEDEYDTYYVTFRLPEGYVLAAYDQKGKILYTVEKFKNISLPAVVSTAVVQRFPGWAITSDTYQVAYKSETATSKMIYKLLLENGDKRMRVKLNEKGEFL